MSTLEFAETQFLLLPHDVVRDRSAIVVQPCDVTGEHGDKLRKEEQNT